MFHLQEGSWCGVQLAVALHLVDTGRITWEKKKSTFFSGISKLQDLELTAASSYGAWSPTTNITGHLIKTDFKLRWAAFNCLGDFYFFKTEEVQLLEGIVAVQVQISAAVAERKTGLVAVGSWCVCCPLQDGFTCCTSSRRARCWPD